MARQCSYQYVSEAQTQASKQGTWHMKSSMLRMSDKTGTSMSPVNGSERVDCGVVSAVVISRCTEDALLRNVCPEVLVVHCQRCLPCAIEPVANKPPVSLQHRHASRLLHYTMVLNQQQQHRNSLLCCSQDSSSCEVYVKRNKLLAANIRCAEDKGTAYMILDKKGRQYVCARNENAG